MRSIATMAALNFRDLSGEGQLIDVSVHEAINTCTEIAMPTYIYNGETVLRQTARHAAPAVTQDAALHERRQRLYAGEPQPV